MWFFAALPKEFSGSYTCTDFVVVMRPSMKTRSLFLMMLAMAASIFFRGCDLREKARMKPMPLCFKIAPMVLQCCYRILQFLSKLSRTMLCLVKLAYSAF